MQEKSSRTNKERTEATRQALLDAARKLFVAKGYADTGTPEIVATAKVTRGALYHHFADKADLFRAVLEREADAVARDIRDQTVPLGGGIDSFLLGANAYFAAMAEAGRARLLLVEGPAVLGLAEMDRIDKATGGAELRVGLEEAFAGTKLAGTSISAITDILSAAFDRAALAIAEGASARSYKAAIKLIVTGLFAQR